MFGFLFPPPPTYDVEGKSTEAPRRSGGSGLFGLFPPPPEYVGAETPTTKPPTDGAGGACTRIGEDRIGSYQARE